ncbi:MAG: dimethylargininase [Thermoanaerobaculia bacterium]|nr:dimethylargininase [Thermoanaerobaculia bacterium]
MDRTLSTASRKRRIAVVREVSPALADCELTHLDRQPIDVDRAQRQHEEYIQALAALGCEIHRLPAEDHLPDCVFIEDTAVVLDEVAILTRPGALSRRAELPTVAEVLARYRSVLTIEAPGTLDGGDVLVLERQIWVGASDRTNPSGIDQLRQHVETYGYTVTAVEMRDCLHLKTAVTAVSSDTLLIQPQWIVGNPFDAWRQVEVDPEEPFAANALRIGDELIYPADFRLTRRRLELMGFTIHHVPADELAKAEGGVTCCSLLLDRNEDGGRAV